MYVCTIDIEKGQYPIAFSISICVPLIPQRSYNKKGFLRMRVGSNIIIRRAEILIESKYRTETVIFTLFFSCTLSYYRPHSHFLAFSRVFSNSTITVSSFLAYYRLLSLSVNFSHNPLLFPRPIIAFSRAVSYFLKFSRPSMRFLNLSIAR